VGPQGYDYVVTLFFIDTSLNIFSTIEHIYTLLRPGGVWINLGPLLWSGSAQAAVELSLEEVLTLVEEVGFTVVRPRHEECQDGNEQATPLSDTRVGEGCERRTVECEYTSDKRAMMKWIYQAEFWVALKLE
jgi:hypothetical protein